MSKRVQATLLAAALLAIVGIAPASGSPGRGDSVAAQRARYWTAERRAAAIPRDLVIDERGRGYLRRPDGTLQPYGASPQPMDAYGPAISNPDPAEGATLTAASHTFRATVTDADGVKSVTLTVKGPAGSTSYAAAKQSGTDVWAANVSNLSNGSWSWSITAKDRVKHKGGNSSSLGPIAFSVNTSGSGGGSEPGTTVANAEYTEPGPVQTASGRIYFEMPVNNRSWGGYVCSGTVARDGTSGRSIIITAAHCVYDDAYKVFARNVLFIPDQDASGTTTDTDCSNDVLGCWAPSHGVVDKDWADRSWPDNIPWDYAYYAVPDDAHRGAGVSGPLDEVAGDLTIQFTAPAIGSYTHALGYSYSDDPKFMYCAEGLAVESRYNDYWLGSCGLSGGASGGPWVQPLVGGDGPIVSVNSWGYSKQPGMAGPRLSGTSASCLFDATKTSSSNLITC